MWYIFKDLTCVVSCDSEPNHEDLESRGEMAIESDTVIDISSIVLNDGVVTQKVEAVLTADEIKKNELDALDVEYQPQFTELSQALNMATLSDNSDLITRIKADYAALKAEYDTKRGEING